MVRVKALGCLVVVGDDGVPLAGAAAQPRRMAMLALLARGGDRGMARDKILALLWPDVEEERARRNLANALSALRKDLGDEAFLGVHTLRLNPDAITSDVMDFTSAMAANRLEELPQLYDGPFLDGFRLPGLEEFDRWTDTERGVVAHEYQLALERLARSETDRGDDAAASVTWRRLAALDPLNARFAIGLMESLAAAGDRSGALRHAQIYEALVEQDLDLPPDQEVLALARRLRSLPRPPTGSEPETSPAPSVPPPVEPPPVSPVSTPVPGHLVPTAEEEVADPGSHEALPARGGRLRLGVIVGAVLVALIAGGWLLLRPDGTGAGGRVGPPIVAIGRINDHRAVRSIELTGPLTDMLATGLGQTPGVRVVSTARMYELLAGEGGNDTTGAAIARAARQAGATELLQGALYALENGDLRLDVQRVDLATGEVRNAHVATGPHAFAIADTLIAQLGADYGTVLPQGSVAEVTTRSLTAYRFYEEGLRAYYQGDLTAAERLFAAATAEDSSFATATYYQALSRLPDETRSVFGLFQRASRLAVHAPERERLIIQTSFAQLMATPDARAMAETLTVRFPHEVQGYQLMGMVQILEGHFLEAARSLDRVIAMDSLSLHGGAPRCLACDAFPQLIGAYEYADSLALAERTARRWVALQPRSGLAWGKLGWVLSLVGKSDEAVAAIRNRSRFGAGEFNDVESLAAVLLHGERYAEADALLHGLLASGSPNRQATAHWYLAISLRAQGRLGEARALAHQNQIEMLRLRPENTTKPGSLLEAQILLEQGHYRDAAAMFDAIARWHPAGTSSDTIPAGLEPWAMTHAANALAAVGDTIGFDRRIETIEALGDLTVNLGNRVLHHHVRGLLLAARGRDEEAVAAFRAALVSRSQGYSRTNYELAKALLRLGRPAEAVPLLQAALRGDIESRHLYLTRTELHELLAQAWEATGGPTARDSARAHYQVVVRDWARADALLQPRVAAARRALTG